MSAISQRTPSRAALRTLNQFDLSDWIGIGAVACALLITLILTITAIVNGFTWRERPFLGAMVSYGLIVDGSQPIGGASWIGVQRGLRRADRLVSIDGVRLPVDDYPRARALFSETMNRLRPGQTVEIAFTRRAPAESIRVPGMTCEDNRDGEAYCTLSLTLTRFPTADLIGFFIVPLISSLITLTLAFVVFALRYTQPSARLVALALTLMAVFMIGLFDIHTTHAFIAWWLLATMIGAGTFVSLALVFPTTTRPARRFPPLRFLPPLVGMAIGFYLVYRYTVSTSHDEVGTLTLNATAVCAIGLIVLLGTLIVRRRDMPTLALRDQANTVLIGVGVSLLVVVLWLTNLFASNILRVPPLPLNTSAAMPFLVLPALSMAYAVLQYRTFDTDRVISTVVTYTLMLFGLVTAYFLLVYAISVFTASVVDADNPIIMAVAIFFIAVLFVPVRTRLQERIENLFFRRRYQLQARIETFARELGARTSLADVLAAYRTEIETTLQPEHLFIFMPDPQTGDFTTVGDAPNGTTDIRFTSTSGLIAALTRSSDAIALDPGVPWDVDLVAERARLNILRAQMLFAMRGSTGTLYGVVIVARPRGQRKSYALEEARYLQNLTAQISVAVERAQAVSTLERRVRELDVLSQISQAVNFTAAYDDLLELIATQAGRLIDVDTLYLTLRDADHDTLYHAFFLENDERLLAREGVRWPIGRDLFSDVVRTAQPLRVRSFTGAMAERGAGPRPESADLRGWMGVPMLVGSRVIGVLSAATTQPGRVFSDDQMKIFGDIASLAATSLDKARLFAETNARARQLSVLNEISRQLVAAEADLEGLLLVITQSSVDILGGEAGSLLLESDDGSGDLEFQIAVGESGNTLKGLRVPAGKGLVGEVASTGQSRIVNDVSTDPRWGGEFAGGAFRTTSILAVPLVTPDRVIGVLEVLNKANGASFTPEDAELLNTFAGQAAVAIENARLFQLTDQQLSQRVRELETLERIDVELNRSLDLAKVARITVEWARENSAAEAAVLGLVSAAADGTPVLDRVASEGYTADDVPPGAEPGANRWPLDRGALERVLRTRQPELIVDAGRADYRPILRGAKSMIVLPMLSAGLVNALLILETKREGGFRIADMPFLQRLTEHASIAITNAQLYAELTRANESKNEFVSFVAHELKNPLTAIKGYSEFLINGALGQLSEPQRNFVTTIRGSADRMTTIVSDLNDVTKLETNNLRMDFAPIAFAAVVTDTLLPLEKQIADKAQVLVLELDEALPDILADHNRLIQVLTNMVSNAHKYSPPGGTITIRADVDTMLTDSKGKRRPPMLHVQVRDTGIGMSAEDLSRLFTPYFRSENPLTREQPGTGLGMTITRGIIDRHGGTIWVESTLGAGTVFHFTLPLAETPVLP